MSVRPSSVRVFWVNPIYRDGSQIGQELLDAATAMRSEAEALTAILLRDIDRTADIMELAVHLAWRKIRQGAVPLTKARFYLRRTFYRLAYRIAWRESWFIYNDPGILQIDLEEGAIKSDGHFSRPERRKRWTNLFQLDKRPWEIHS